MSDAHGRTFNERYEDNFLARLRTLPEPAFRQCVYRLQDGESAISVARWLLAVPNRGGMQRVDKLHTLRRYMEILARQVLRLKKHAPPSALTTKELQQIVEQEHQRVENEIAIAGGPLNGQFQSMINDIMNHHAKACDRRLWLQATVAMNLRRLQLANFLEEKLKTPILEGTKISQVIIQAAEADMRAELADLNIRKARQDENAKLFGAITLDDVDEQPEPVSNASAPAAQSAVGECTYRVSPTLSEIIETFINNSPAQRMTAAAVINLALAWIYSADLLRETEEEQAQPIPPPAAGEDFENGSNRESQESAAKAGAPPSSPEEHQEPGTTANGGEGPRSADEELEEFIPVLNYVSAADRMAVCGVLEAMLMIVEAENVFRKEPQTADPPQESDGSTISPRVRYYMSRENFELLQEMVTGQNSFSPVARKMYKEVFQIATKVVERELIAAGACS